MKVSSNEEIRKYIASRIENNEIYHFPILYNGNNLPYDWQTNTLYIPQNMDGNHFEGKLEAEYGELVFSMDIEIDHSEKIYTDEFTGEIKKEQSEYNSKESVKSYISQNAVFKLYLTWDNYFKEYNVIFTGLPVMSLTYDSYDAEKMSWDGHVVLMDPYHKKNGYVSMDCEYHLRGDSTSHSDKKSYEINLEGKEALLGMRKDDDWAAVAMLGDNGFVHNKLSYDIWNKISATNETVYDNTVNSDYIEVFYDNTYVGLYLLCEKIDRKQCKLGDGDYLFRLDELRSEENTLNTYEKQFDFRIKWPKEYSEEDYQIINNFERVFYSKEGFKLNEAIEMVNMDNITDMNLYSMLICGVDNWDANCFYIAPKADNYRISEVMWDMNETFGDDEWFNYQKSYETSPDMMIPYVKKIYDSDKSYMSSVMNKRWKKLRRTVIDKKELTEEARQLEEYICNSGALKRESDKWFCYLKPEWRYSNLYGFIENRIDYLDNFWEKEYKNNN